MTSESMLVPTWRVRRTRATRNLASFCSKKEKIGRDVGRIGPQTSNTHSTLASSLRHGSRWDEEEKFRRFCVFLPCLVVAWLVLGGRLRDFEGGR